MRFSVATENIPDNYHLSVLRPESDINGKKIVNGKTVSFTAITYPSNYVGKKGYGIVTWSVTPSDKAEINPNTGKLTIKADGRITVTVSYKETQDSKETKISHNFEIMGFFPERYENALDFKITSVDNKLIKDIQPMYVGSTTNWVIHSNYGFVYRENVLGKILDIKKPNAINLTITAQKVGTDYIKIYEKMTGKKIIVKITISSKPDLQITRAINNKNIFENEENVFVGSSKSWTISSTHKWSYSVSKPGIIKVNLTKNGISYTALSPGTTQLTIVEPLGASGHNSKTITIKVSKQPTKFTISTSTATLGTGESLQFDYQTNDGVEKYISKKYITWYSTNESVAKINENGLLSSSREGTTKVYAIYNNKDYGGTAIIQSRQITITVIKTIKPNLETTTRTVINIKPNKDSVKVGGKVTFTSKLITYNKYGVKINEKHIENNKLRWTTSDSINAEIDTNGVFKATKAGTYTVFVSFNQSTSASYPIEVKYILNIIINMLTSFITLKNI